MLKLFSRISADKMYEQSLELRPYDQCAAPLCRVARLFNIFPLHDARRRRRTPAKYSQLVPQLDDFIIPAPSKCRGRPMPRGGLVCLCSSSSSFLLSLSLSLPPPPLFPLLVSPPFSHRVLSSCISAFHRFSVQQMLHAMITNAGIPQESLCGIKGPWPHTNRHPR